MNDIQMKGIDSPLRQVVLEDIQHLKQHFNNIFAHSDQTLIQNSFEQVETLLEEAKDDKKSYETRHLIFARITEVWFDLHKHYKDTPEAIELIKMLDHLANYSIAFSRLFLSLSLINEGKTGEYSVDLARAVPGFLLLSETVDVFVEFFAIEELKQIYEGAKDVISTSARNIGDYFEDGLELSNLVTQLRAYSSLIVLKLEECFNQIGSISEIETAPSQDEMEQAPSSKPWWEQIVGTFADEPSYDEAMRLGREYRDSFRPSPTDLIHE